MLFSIILFFDARARVWSPVSTGGCEADAGMSLRRRAEHPTGQRAGAPALLSFPDHSSEL